EMKLEESVENIREKITNTFNKSLSIMGLSANKQLSSESLDPELQIERKRIADILNNLEEETGDYPSARDKLLEELSFTLFNRIAGIKVIEANQLQPEVITCRTSHAGRSFGHKLWLEQNPDKKNLPLDGLKEYIRYTFNQLSDKIQLYSSDHLYDLLPEVYNLKEIINEFNKIDEENWQSDDIMGWLYESYNRKKRESFKNSNEKIEYNWVSVTSQIYTPRWVVEFILNNSLGKLWMEMHPESKFKENHNIANIPKKPIVKTKPVREIKVIDPAVGSGNFLLYAFDLFYEMYIEEGKYAKDNIPQLIIENNLYGIDLDDRAVQIAQLALYIKALKKNKNIKISKMNIVSSDFYLPEYNKVEKLFSELIQHPDTVNLLREIWEDLRMAYKFGSLIRIEEKIEYITNKLKSPGQEILWGNALMFWDEWKAKVFRKIIEALQKYSKNNNGNIKFFKTKTQDSMIFAEIISNKYDIAVANPPYTDSGSYGKELKIFVTKNYKTPLSFYSNLYAVFLKRCSELINENGKIGMIHPPTFMYLKSFEDIRRYILDKFHIHIFIEWGYLGIFTPTARVDSAIYILERKKNYNRSIFIKLNDLYETKRKESLFNAFSSYFKKENHKLLFIIDQSKLKNIESYPFVYWISDEFREKFKSDSITNVVEAKSGLATADNNKFLRFWWEIDLKDISKDYEKDKKKWVPYSKGGPFNKWYGNLWLVLNWENNGKELRESQFAVLRNEECYFKEGITYAASGSIGPSFRILPKNHIYDVGGASIFFKNNGHDNINYVLAFLNSCLSMYILDCFNPTVNIQIGDLQRLPFIIPLEKIGEKISSLAKENVKIKKHLCEFSIIEMNYKYNPILWAKEKHEFPDLRKLIKAYLDYENKLLTQVYLNEALIDELIFQVYQTTEEDKQMILEKEGPPVGSLPLVKDYISISDQLSPEVKDYIKTIKIKDINSEEKEGIKKTILQLYQQSIPLEEICNQVQINPLSIIQIIKENHSLPEKRFQEIAQDLLFDLVREILEED
ncbi:MAG: BREX-1 system adenine-specific DNA-methyltransferase PglX, partial [Promethearchaeota archaeon]